MGRFPSEFREIYDENTLDLVSVVESRRKIKNTLQTSNIRKASQVAPIEEDKPKIMDLLPDSHRLSDRQINQITPRTMAGNFKGGNRNLASEVDVQSRNSIIKFNSRSKGVNSLSRNLNQPILENVIQEREEEGKGTIEFNRKFQIDENEEEK
jgi:hypothetical protein